MPNHWLHIREMLPEHEDTINLLVAKASEFRNLCRDFDDCVDAMRRWCRSQKPEAGRRAEEYRAILSDLFKEIRHYLEIRA